MITICLMYLKKGRCKGVDTNSTMYVCDSIRQKTGRERGTKKVLSSSPTSPPPSLYSNPSSEEKNTRRQGRGGRGLLCELKVYEENEKKVCMGV